MNFIWAITILCVLKSEINWFQNNQSSFSSYCEPFIWYIQFEKKKCDCYYGFYFSAIKNNIFFLFFLIWKPKETQQRNKFEMCGFRLCGFIFDYFLFVSLFFCCVCYIIANRLSFFMFISFNLMGFYPVSYNKFHLKRLQLR